MKKRPVLIVEDDKAMGALLIGAMQKVGLPTSLAASLQAAREAMNSSQSLAGAVVDLGLPDGCGGSLVHRLRLGHPSIPIVVFAGSNMSINEAFSLKCFVLSKPFGRRELSELQKMFNPPKQQGTFFLPPRQQEILSLAAMGVPRREMALRIGVSEHTIKWHTRELLALTGERSLRALVIRFLRQQASEAVEQQGADGSERGLS